MGAVRLLVACAAAAGLLTGCVSAPRPPIAAGYQGSACSSASATIAFDFETAPQSACTVDGERAFSLLVTPEHAPPINPSPWYAFRYRSEPGAPLTVRLRYLGAKHRYAPLLTRQGSTQRIPAAVANDSATATIELPAGEGTVSGQEIFDASRHEGLAARLMTSGRARREALGTTHDGRTIAALRWGRPDAPRLLVLLGRQHPPEVTGALAMEAFLEILAEEYSGERTELRDVQVVAVPLLNPDGVARGHWRANRGGTDLNRDWGAFSQPETRAVKAWLDRLPGGVRPVAMIDFHSTWRNLFYVQGADENPRGDLLLDQWLKGRERAIPGYEFTIEPRNANPGSGTAKNWFFATYGIPSYTYEVGDETDRTAIETAARDLARRLVAALASQP